MTVSASAADLAIVGGGIVGLATGMAWLEHARGSSLVILEKEARLASHQSSHNSGVIHSGVYYRPGSVRAKTCVAGSRLLVEFCEARRIPYRRCGKVIVATTASELPALETLYQRGMANGVTGLSLIGPERLRELEPHAQGLKALHVPGAGIVDYVAVADAFAQTIEAHGGEIRRSARVLRCAWDGGVWVLETTAGSVRARHLITCAGLHADRVSAMAGASRTLQIVPFRGEYYGVIPARRDVVRGMVYPVPQLGVPFLGVHFTRSIDGGLHAGPNAVLALKREGYRVRDISGSDMLDLVRFPGFWKMIARHGSRGLGELYRAMSKGAFVRALQRLVPDIRTTDLVPAPSGVRAQALDREGSLLDDFDIVRTPQAIHVRNVPSPAATASIAIGRTIAEMAATAFGSAPQ